jgi:uncharacterized protein
MNLVRGARIAATLALGAALLLSSGCGYKNLPVPPESVVPVVIQDLRYAIDDKGVKLTWTYPVETIKGTEIPEIATFELYEAEVSLQDYCGTCPVPFTKPVEVAGGVTSIQGKKRTATYENTQLASGRKYFFKVRSRTSWWASSDDSNIVSFVWHVPAAAPQGLTAKAADRQVSLKWQAVSTLQDGSPAGQALQYRILRSIDGKDFTRIGEPVNGASYVDRDVRNGQKYVYKVQSLMRIEKEQVDGGQSEAVAVNPVDQTPLLPPGGVRVIDTAAGIKVVWDKSEAKDLGGYKIYRRSADRDDFELVGEVEAQFTIFVDTTAKADIRYYYVVTAVTSAAEPIESAKSREATSRR